MKPCWRRFFHRTLGGPDTLRVAGPIAVDDAVEASGIKYAGTRHLVFFVDVMAYERFRQLAPGTVQLIEPGGEP